MKNFKLYMLFTLMMIAFTGCKIDDLKDDVNDLKDRVTLLEEQVKILNENLDIISYLFNDKLVITSCTPNGSAPSYDSYTIKFSDNTELTLTLGSESSVRLPDMKVVDGKWVIEGVPTDVPVSNDTPGVDANNPKFELIKDETEGRYYWTVSYDGGTTKDPITDSEGNKIYVTVDDKLPSDPNFVTAGLSQDGKTFDLVLSDGSKMCSVPVVSDLLCSIYNPFGTDELDIVEGKTVNLKVDIKGDDYFVNVPHGYTASISELHEDGYAVLAVTSVPAPNSRLAADNSRDLSVMVNKGHYWAVDKLQLNTVSESQASVEVKYISGIDIMVCGEKVNISHFGSPLIMKEDMQIVNTDKQKYQVFFIPGGKTLTVNPEKYDNNGKPGFRQYTGENLVFVSSDKSNPGIVKFPDQGYIGISVSNPDTDAYLLAENVIIDKSESAKYLITPLKKTKRLIVKFHSCKLLMDDQPITYLNSSHFYDSFEVTNCDIKYTNKIAPFFFSLGTKAIKLGDITFMNNIIYCSKGHKIQYKLLNSASTEVGNVKFEKNTVVNLEPRKTGFFNVSSVQSIEFNNNIFWSDAEASADGNFITVFKNGLPAEVKGSADKNLYFSLTAFNLFTEGKLFEGFKAFIKPENDPFEGGTFDLESGKFIPNDTYKDYGATRN